MKNYFKKLKKVTLLNVLIMLQKYKTGKKRYLKPNPHIAF